MTTSARCLRAIAALTLVGASGAWFDGAARGQGAIAFQPVVSPLLNGAALTATPVVSADRLYVRMTLNPYFNTVNGFSTYSSQLGAVSGGGFAGMGGVVGGGVGVPMNSGYVETGTYLAGSFPPPGVLPGAGFAGVSDPFPQGAMPAGGTGFGAGFPGQGFVADRAMPDPLAGIGDFAEQPTLRSGKSTAARRQAARKSSRHSTTTTKRRR